MYFVVYSRWAWNCRPYELVGVGCLKAAVYGISFVSVLLLLCVLGYQ